MIYIENLLWVEDQIQFVDSLTPVLENCCKRIQHVSNLADACTAFESTSFDLVLLDLQLEPGKWQGLDFLRLLGSRAATVPIIVLSGAGTLAECIEAIRLGAKDYVQKENARTDLELVITKVIVSFRAQQPLDDYARIRKIERILKELIVSLLQASAIQDGKDIFRSYVPIKVALKSYERWCQSEEGNQEDFLDILDLAAIIDFQWNQLVTFQVLQKILNPKNREERTRWLVELNEARKLVAHPTRGDVGDEERRAIQRTEEIVAKWIELSNSGTEKQKYKIEDQ